MSKITLHTEPFHYLEITGLWDEKERDEMFAEMLLFEAKGVFATPEETGSSEYADGTLLKNNTGLWFDTVFRDRNHSSILKHNKKLFGVLRGVKNSWFFNGLFTNEDTTLVSYYEDSCYYKSHRDGSSVTSTSWFFKEPKKFSGGDITFTDYDLTFKVTNDLTLVFPSNIKHEVSKISIQDSYRNAQNGRFCMTQFLGSKINQFQ